MSIFSVLPAAGNRLGSGHLLWFDTDQPYDSTWWARVQMTDGTWPVTEGVQHLVAGDTPHVLIGYSDGADGGPDGVWGSLTSAIVKGLNADAAINAIIQLYDGGGVFRDTLTVAYKWDPVSGLPYLIRSAAAGGHDPMLDTILARVTVKGY